MDDLGGKATIFGNTHLDLLRFVELSNLGETFTKTPLHIGPGVYRVATLHFFGNGLGKRITRGNKHMCS